MANVRVIEAIPQRETALRVAAYCRVSSGSEDQLHSYASQIKHYTELIQNTPGWQLVDIYADEGISGTGTDKREEFRRMLRDARRGKMDKILVKSSSRFARNTHDCLAALRELKAIGVSVRFEKENLDTENLEIELMLAVSGSLAQEESVSISNNQRISYKNRMEKGTFLTCKAPFGYELVNGNELRIKEDEAKLVRWIFESYLSGKGIYEMAEEITAMGIPSRDGRPYWQHSTILYVLRNEKYCGDALVQKTFATDTFPSRKQHNKGEKAQYYIQNSHPAIISRETFEQAQRLCDSRRAEHGEAKEYPLSRKLVCGECGATFKRRVSQRGYVSWVCRRRDRSKDACTVGRVAEESIYAAFMELCRTLKAHGDTIIQPAIDQLQALQNALLRGNPEMVVLHTEMAKLTEQGELLSRLRSKNLLDTEAYMARSNAVNARLRELRAKRRALLRAEDDEGPERLRELWDILNNTENTQEFDAALFESTVENIVVESQERIRIRLKCGLELTEPVHGKGR